MPEQYLTRYGFRLPLIVGVDGRSVRFYRCELCHIPVWICSRCDRGQRYCSKAHSEQARLCKQRTANARWQSSRRGRRKHAERAARYRARREQARRSGPLCEGDGSRQASPNNCVNQVDRAALDQASQKKVTYQGSPTPPAHDWLGTAVIADRRRSSCWSLGRLIVRCRLCGRRCGRGLRRAFPRRRPAPRTVRRRRGSDP
jgi:hypothetical protein